MNDHQNLRHVAGPEIEALRQTHCDLAARFRFATEATGLGVWELDLASGTLTTSPLCRRIFGREPDQPFSYDDLLAAVHPSDHARMRATVELARTTGRDYEIEYRIIRPDQTLAWVRICAQVMPGPDGTATRMAGISADVSERREAEQALQLSDESLRLSTDSADIGIWDLDLIADVLTWSDRTKALFGMSPGTPCGMTDFYAGLHPDDREETSRAFASALDPALRATYDVEYRTIGKEDGVLRWVAARGRGLFDADGRCVRALGTAIDITARKQAGARQQFLVELWDHLRGLTDPRAILETAARALGRHLHVARVGYGTVQSDDRTIVLETLHSVGVPPLTGPFPMDGFGEANILRQRHGVTVVVDDIADDAAQDSETWNRLGIAGFVSVPLIREGRLRATLYVNDHRVRRWTVADVTLIEDVAARTWDAVERARAEAALRDTNENLERLVAERTRERDRTWNNAQDLLVILERDGGFRAVNPAWTTILGWPQADLVGRPLFEIIVPDDLSVTRDALVSARDERLPVLVNRCRHQDGGERWIEWIAVPDGDLIYASGRDITETRVQAEMLARAEEALRQAQKMEAVGQLTGGIAHDFNNLLGGIMGSLELVQRRVAAGRTDGLERYTNSAITSAQRAAALTQRLLAFARRQPLDPKRVDANRLVAGMEDLLRRTLGPSITCELVLAGGLWPTLCDPNQLESAILNLAINARDAMPDGGRLTLETANAHLDDAYARGQGGEVRAGQYVAVSLSDSGTGMTPDVMARAFDPFFTTKPTGQGTGLGLSMLYGFIKQSEGHVRVYSEIGQGTTFKIYLPRFRGADTVAERLADTEVPGVVRAEVGETVLVVDDEAALRMLVTETLEELGYNAIEAPDGQTALRILQSSARVDLLVTDVGLPGLNGRQLADAARVTRPGLRVLFITGYAHNAALGNGDALAPDMEMLTKPFALDALARKIRGMIERA